MQFNETLLIRLFIDLDDFCNQFESWQLASGKQNHEWTCRLSCSEVMTLIVFYQQSGYKCFQYYYQEMVYKNMLDYFPELVTYKRFLSVIPCCLDQLYMFAQWQAT